MSQPYLEVQFNAPVHEGDVDLDQNIIAREAPILAIANHAVFLPNDIQISRPTLKSRVAGGMVQAIGTRRRVLILRSAENKSPTS